MLLASTFVFLLAITRSLASTYSYTKPGAREVLGSRASDRSHSKYQSKGSPDTSTEDVARRFKALFENVNENLVHEMAQNPAIQKAARDLTGQEDMVKDILSSLEKMLKDDPEKIMEDGKDPMGNLMGRWPQLRNLAHLLKPKVEPIVQEAYKANGGRLPDAQDGGDDDNDKLEEWWGEREL